MATGLFIVIVITGSLLVLIISGAIFLCIAFTLLYNKRASLSPEDPITRIRPNKHTNPTDIESNNNGGITTTTTTTSFDPSIEEVSMSELITATSNFDPAGIIGDGGFGLVYRAVLPSSGTTVAVKKLSHDALHGLREFRAEMETLASIRHRHIVRILGFCVSGPDRVLIYEFVERGSLDEWLHQTDDDEIKTESESSSSSFRDVTRWPLSWGTRLKVVRGVAMGLAHMHGLDRPIIHRDIKAGNVLLDTEFEAHIADFGLARRIAGAQSHVSTQVAGTMGYMPPEYRAGYTAATVKADVYSFGVLLFEVVTGRRPSWPVREEVRLVEWAKRKIAAGEEMEIVDGRMIMDEVAVREVEVEITEVLRVADVCTSEKAEDRPRSSHVVLMLNRI